MDKPDRMFRPSIQRKIVSIALGLIVLMVVTSVLSIVLSAKVSHLLDELTNRYIPAYGHLARTNIRSLERSLAMRRMMITKMQAPDDLEAYSRQLKAYEAAGVEVEREAGAARQLILAIIADESTPSDVAGLTRIETRIDTALRDLRTHLDRQNAVLQQHLDRREVDKARAVLDQVDVLRDEFMEKIETIRADMLKQVYASASTVVGNQQRTIIISAIVTGLAAAIGLAFAIVISGGITRPVLQLLERARAVEKGQLDTAVIVSGRDEIAQLAQAFNNMVTQLRENARIRETFGRYIDPQVVKGLIDQSSIAAEGQRRAMTVMFCDMKGFTSMSEGMTPRGLVQVMNRYFSTMSEPIRTHRGVIDKYIGDAIMAYWGPPFVGADEEARLACEAALEMAERIPTLREEMPELLGVKLPNIDVNVRIGIATGDVLVGSIGSELMMSYTVMGDAVNLASRLEGANNTYGTRILASDTAAESLGGEFELREIDRLLLSGQRRVCTTFEVMGRAGELSAEQEQLRERYAEGLAAYRARDWDGARKGFTAALEAVADDGPSLAMLSRLEHIERDPPADDWDGAWNVAK